MNRSEIEQLVGWLCGVAGTVWFAWTYLTALASITLPVAMFPEWWEVTYRLAWYAVTVVAPIAAACFVIYTEAKDA